LRVPNVFAGNYLDRVAHLRKDAAFLSSALRDPAAAIVPVWQSRSLVRRTESGSGAVLLESMHAIRGALDDAELILLGQFRGRVVFAAELGSEQPPDLRSDGEFQDLRIAGAFLPHDEAGLLAYARAMVLWRRRHRYCGTCGAPNVPASAGHVMTCSRTGCGEQQFPRLDPAIIVLVTDGERALLGRQASWPPGRFSTIAGFVEPGESFEDAVIREVAEETAVVVRECGYHSSQPWPFPSSLMIGFTAVAEPGCVPKADEELEDVRWFTREEIAGGFPGLPPPQSVSYRLIEDWYDAGSDRKLRETPGVRLWGRER
jgi:NAD+ diphosphatase